MALSDKTPAVADGERNVRARNRAEVAVFVAVLVTLVTPGAFGHAEPGVLADAVTLATLCVTWRRGTGTGPGTGTG
ncbi:hypothetical protein [Streptomyces sp. NPDC051219]|uniref:hypothetical protein n=1 Tax=Streptomyces sp. NPDC051219 TaxID=3155283 RepID=UPI00342EEC67